jgi:hypothetical protein
VRLAELLAAHAPYDGSFPLRVPGVHAIRRSTVSRDMVRATVSPALCVVAQGAKVVVLGREVYAYDASRMIAYSVELPVAAQIVRATRREPFLALKLDLHGYKIAELSLRVFPHGVPSPRETRGVCVGQTTTAIVDAASRLIELMADSTDAELFAPLVIDEILMRLARSSIGPRVALLGQQESGVQRVTKAVTWPARAGADGRVHDRSRSREGAGGVRGSEGRRGTAAGPVDRAPRRGVGGVPDRRAQRCRAGRRPRQRSRRGEAPAQCRSEVLENASRGPAPWARRSTRTPVPPLASRPPRARGPGSGSRPT